ncbi:hypothetical protein D3C85_1747140 [compost metagenome]
MTEKQPRLLAKMRLWMIILLIVASLMFSAVTRDITAHWWKGKEMRQNIQLMKLLGIGQVT